MEWNLLTEILFLKMRNEIWGSLLRCSILEMGSRSHFSSVTYSILLPIYGLFYSGFFYFHQTHLLQLYLLTAEKDVLTDVAPALSLRGLCNERSDVGRTKGGKAPVSFHCILCISCQLYTGFQ